MSIALKNEIEIEIGFARNVSKFIHFWIVMLKFRKIIRIESQCSKLILKNFSVQKKQQQQFIRIAFTHFKWPRYVNKINLILSYRYNSIKITKNFILITVMPEFSSYFFSSSLCSDSTWSSMLSCLMQQILG